MHVGGREREEGLDGAHDDEAPESLNDDERTNERETRAEARDSRGIQTRYAGTRNKCRKTLLQ